MRFVVLWINDEGFGYYAEHFEAASYNEALRFVGRKLNTLRVDKQVCGFFLDFADSEFVRKYSAVYQQAYGRKVAAADADFIFRKYPHLKKPS